MKILLASLATSALGLLPADCPDFVVIQDVKDISDQMKQDIVAGIKAMKTIPSAYQPEWNAYDYFPWLHGQSTAPGVMNHATWAFPFWHRVFMHRWNSELRRATNNPNLTFPYWDFTSQESLEAWLDDLKYIGGRGLQENGYVLQEGNMRTAAGFPIFANATTWPQASAQGALLRAPGNGIQMCLDAANNSYYLDSIFNYPEQDLDPVGPFISLPEGAAPNMTDWMLTPDAGNRNCSWSDGSCLRTYTNATLNVTLTCKHLANRLPNAADQEACLKPWKPYLLSQINVTTLPSASFSPCLEGLDWDDVYARGLERLGASVHAPHGMAHQWIGGSLGQSTAPADPAFTHIHNNVDRLFREGQLVAATMNAWNFNQETLDTKIELFVNPEVTVGEYLDIVKLGYVFDTDTCPSDPVGSDAARGSAAAIVAFFLLPLLWS